MIIALGVSLVVNAFLVWRIVRSNRQNMKYIVQHLSKHEKRIRHLENRASYDWQAI